MTLELQEQNALDIIDRAFQKHQPSHVFALCSGGNDSLTATHLASRHPNFSGVVHIDTGIKVIDEGYRAEDHVRQICEERGWEFLVYRAVDNTYEDGSPDPQIYEELVLMGANGKGFPNAGFPGPALHSFIYSRLKERQISRLVREHKQHSKDKIMLVTGVRRHESERRWRNLDRWGEVDVDGSKLWVNTIIDFTAEECSAYMKKYGMKANPVRDLICMSGECLCGCFSKPGEIEIIEACLPKTGAHLRELEAKAKALGYPWGWGEEPPAWWSNFRNGDTFYPEFTDEDDSNPSILHLCTTCQSKHLEDQALRQEMQIDTPSTITMTTSEITIPDTVPQFTYQFTAIKGLQAQETFYSAMMPIGILVELLVFDEEELPPELRAQRPLNPARIPEIASYVVENPNNYIFDSITVAFEYPVHFAPFMTDGIGMAGTVFIPMNAKLRIINGQHRRAGLKEAIARNPALAKETISVLIYPNRPLLTQQQNFSDLNMYGQKVTKSLSILYNTRSESATLMHRVHRGIPLFTRLIEVERTSLARRSTKLFCLNHLYEATALNLFDGKTPMTVDEKVDIAISFWTELIKYMPHWNYVLDGQLAAPAVRQDYLHVQGVFLVAFGRLGRILMSKHPSDWQSKLKGLEAVDWSRNNPEWHGIALFGGKVENSVLVGATIKKSSKVVSAIVDHLLSKLEG